MSESNPVKHYDFTEAEVSKLFKMQDELNQYIHPEWKTQGFDWGLAIVDECMEIHGHLGWKWWKKGYQVGLTEENRKQIQLEVIDILHFVVSQTIDGNYISASQLARTFNRTSSGHTAQEVISDVMSRAADNFIPDHDWAHLAHSVGLTKPQILETYTQKYVLNKFRQDHGYKDGSYQKHWECEYNGHGGLFEEDNFWLEDIVTQLRQGNHDTMDEVLIYSELKQLYNSRLNQPSEMQ